MTPSSALTPPATGMHKRAGTNETPLVSSTAEANATPVVHATAPGRLQQQEL